MTDEQTTSGLDLHLDLTARRRDAVRAALVDAVRAGRLAPGTRLPASRSLAADLGVARSTVVEAYAELVAEGWLTARQGSGTRVADVPADVVVARPRPADRGPSYDLVPGRPDLTSFPRRGWLAAVRGAVDGPAVGLGYDDPRGARELREALVRYLGRVRGVRTEPDLVVITAGFSHALRLVAATGRGEVVVEGWSLPTHRQAWTDAGYAVRPVPVDQDGARLDDPAALTGATAALLTPAHQFPLGAVLAPRRRTAVTGWARDTGALVVEDDYDGEFRYDRRPVGSLQGLAPEAVVYAGTASKTLAPGLRLGWLAVPRSRIDAVVAAAERSGAQPSAIDQRALARVLESGEYDRHVRTARLRYRRRRDRLLAALAAGGPGVEVSGIAAGLHVLLTLPAGLSEEGVLARAADLGLAVQGLRTYRTGVQDHPPALVIGYGTPPDHAVGGAYERLLQAIEVSAR